MGLCVCVCVFVFLSFFSFSSFSSFSFFAFELIRLNPILFFRVESALLDVETVKKYKIWPFYTPPNTPTTPNSRANRVAPAAQLEKNRKKLSFD